MAINVRRRRMKLYRQGNDRCPICFLPFSAKEVLAGQIVTLEHVPPIAFKKKFGLKSRGLCLTCSNCNNTAGREMDQLALKALAAPIGHMKIGGVSCNVEISLPEAKGSPISITAKSMSGPIDYFAPSAKDAQIRFSIPNQRYADASWLKSAYLSVFSLLGKQGYRYAQGEAIRQIREQIMSPEEQIIKNVPFGQATGRDPGDWIFMNLRDVRPCWLVSFGQYCVSLPPSWDTAFFDDDAFCVGNNITFGDGWFFDRHVFGSNVVGTASFRDKAALEKALGDSPLGGDVQVTSKGETRYYVLADYDGENLTLLPVPRPAE